MNTLSELNATKTENTGSAGNTGNAGSLGLAVFKPYSPQLPIAEIAGQRVVKCLYKTNTATGKAAGTNSYTQVPDYITAQFVKDNIDRCAGILADYMQEQENALVKKLHLKGGDSLAFSDVSFDSLLAFIAESNTSNRLTAAQVETWFDECIYDSLQILLTNKLKDANSEMPDSLVDTKVNAHIALYRKKIAGLASGKGTYKMDELDQIEIVIDTCSESDSGNISYDNKEIRTRIIAKIDTMRKKHAESSELVSIL